MAPPFLISNFSFNRGFQKSSRGEPPQGLTLNLEPVISLALSLISMYNNYRCEYCIPVARISGGDLDTAHVLF